jgi:hypothetical protein
MKTKWIRWFFGLAALYDGVLGALFLAAAPWLFELVKVTPPNHYGYVQFPALLLLVFAMMFARIACNPQRHRELMLYGAGLKAAYCGVVLYHYFLGNIPWVWVPFAYADLAFLVLFLVAWMQTQPPSNVFKDSVTNPAP